MEESGAKPVCAEEALSLLNCVTQSPYDENKCLLLLHSLRDCVLAKKVKNFSLAGQEKQKTEPSSQKHKFRATVENMANYIGADIFHGVYSSCLF
ncbi:uncharacterized protein LOC106767287 [Vigna radiata var. radiata]|uniref:Uncharacterized protein LOC106767287 n=1 Tax=Vigna radiata var. radiata TaxID=3916 RepID=A0A1S3UNW2_VIGRR|nr:uncharacterized protein LOC106767287 [Vigna radiata var. radiata]